MNRNPVRGEVWRNKESGELYTVVILGLTKTDHSNQSWLPSVTYQSNSTGGVYTRPLTSFGNKFERKEPA